MAKTPDLSGLGIDELNAVIADATKQRDTLIDNRRAELLAELEKLGGIPAPSRRSGGGTDVGSGRARAKPEPVFRAPSGETWTGRGAIPRVFKDLGVADKAGMEAYRIKK